ncbi:MAG: hypothetical protein ACHQPI_09320 [Thermoanaerobaculia bacterium]
MDGLFQVATPAYFAAALVWGALLAVSFAGWGTLLVRLVSPGRRLDAGLRAAMGLALTVAVGGVFNLLSWISRTGVLLWVAGGVGWFVVDFLRGRKRISASSEVARERAGPIGFVALSFVVVLSGILYAGSVNGRIWAGFEYRDFDLHDDEQSYLVYPLKMLDRGGLGAEPFDTRRLVVLGGQSLLHAFLAVLFPPRTTHLLDAGVGLLVALGVLWGAGRAKARSRAAATLPLLVLLLLPVATARGNTTSLLTGTALLLAAYRLVDERPFAAASPLRRAVPLGLVVTALVALKTTFLPALVLFLAADTLFAFSIGEGKLRLSDSLLAGSLALAALLPWMISAKLSSGSLLFPLLGRGFQGDVPWREIPGIPKEALDPQVSRLALLSRGLVPAFPFALLTGIAGTLGRRTAAAMGFAAFLLPTVLRFAGDSFLERSITRYAFPAVAAAVPLLVLASLSSWAERPAARSRALAASSLLVAAGILFSSGRDTTGAYREAVKSIRSAISGGPLVDAAAVARVSTLLVSVPPDAPVLVRIPLPYLLDPAAHRIFLETIPGFSSPPPGMPFFRGPEPLAEYLLGRGIHHLAYGDRHGGESLLELTEDAIRFRYPFSESRWALLSFHRDFHRNVRELSFTRRRLADRPDAFVLDLGSRALRLPLLEAPERLEGFTPDCWTEGPALIRLDYERGEEDRFLRMNFSENSSSKVPRVSVDGTPLAVVRAEGTGIVLDLSGAPKRLGTLSLDGPPIEVTGVAAVARAEDVPLVGPPPQHVESPLEIASVSWKSGVWGDRWTNGDALLSNLEWTPKRGETELILELSAGPPGPPEDADVRVLVNGVALRGVGVSGYVWRYRLPPDLRQIRRIRILSKTFVPKEMGLNDDARRLGVTVARVRLVPSG